MFVPNLCILWRLKMWEIIFPSDSPQIRFIKIRPNTHLKQVRLPSNHLPPPPRNCWVHQFQEQLIHRSIIKMGRADKRRKSYCNTPWGKTGIVELLSNSSWPFPALCPKLRSYKGEQGGTGVLLSPVSAKGRTYSSVRLSQLDGRRDSNVMAVVYM